MYAYIKKTKTKNTKTGVMFIEKKITKNKTNNKQELILLLKEIRKKISIAHNKKKKRKENYLYIARFLVYPKRNFKRNGSQQVDW